MSNFTFEDYVRVTMGGAINAANGGKLTKAQMDRVADYLKAPGSGPDAVTSYETYVMRQMAAHPPELPRGLGYVGFSGTDSAGDSNLQNATEYTKQGGRSGIIGDTPWGKFIDQARADPDFGNIESKFRGFLINEGIKPYGGNYQGALQDMMWNAGSSPFIENAVPTSKPMRAFVDGAPDGRGFSKIELPTLLKHPDAIINGYPVSSFGKDPLGFARQTAVEFDALEKSLAQAATINAGTPVSVADIQKNVRLIHGYDGLDKTVFGQSIADFSKLDLARMSAVSDAWMLAPGKATVVARIKEPEHIKTPADAHPSTGPPGASKLAGESVESALFEKPTRTHAGLTSMGDEAALRPQFKSIDAARMARLAGEAALVIDAATTTNRTSDLLDQRNLVGARSEILHFGSRNLGMLGGAMLGAEFGAAIGWETGPGALVTTAAGGVAGTIAGDKIAAMIDEHRIYTQDDKEGNTWHFDPETPEKGWTRTIESTRADLNPGSSHLKPFSHQIQVMRAEPELASELSFKASGQAVQMALAHAPAPRDPYSLPAGPQDPHSIRDHDWIRDAKTHTWERQVDTRVIEHGQYVSHVEQAPPQRTAELNRASEAVLAHNATQTRHAISERYQAAFDHFDWQRFGMPPEAVALELGKPATRQQGSDGEEYTRNADGEWSRARWFGDTTAEGNLRDELNDAFQRQSGSPAHDSPDVFTRAKVLICQPRAVTSGRPEGLSAEPRPPITPQSSNREMFDAMMTAARNLDIDAMRSVSQNYLQSQRGQAWLEQGQQFNQQQAMVQQQAAMDARQQSQAAAQGPVR